MKILRSISLLLSAALIFTLFSCGNSELKNDIKPHADVMCKMISVREELGKVNPSDTAKVTSLQVQFQNLETEFTILNHEFSQKYGDKMKDKDFNKKYMKELSKLMLDECPNLSKENRAMFEKSLKD